MEPGDFIADTEIKGFVARKLKSGVTTYGFRYRESTAGKQRWIRLGLHGSVTADEARAQAKKRAGEVADERDPIAERKAQRAAARAEANAAASTVNALLDSFLARYVRKNNLRTADWIERAFEVHVRPRIGGLSIYDLKRSDIVKMLDEIEDKGAGKRKARAGAPVMADRVLANLRKAFNWHASRDDSFNPPIVKGMARTKPQERARKRTLSEEEIRDLWAALDRMSKPAPYPALVRTLLLTAQRRDEVAQMAESEIEGDMWIIPAARYKTNNDNIVPLTSRTLAVLSTARSAGDGKGNRSGFVFSTTGGKRPFTGFSKAKRALDEQIAAIRKADRREPMAPWTLHDLRRTARSLMSRAGVLADIAERVLGHVIPGVRGVYDRHEYAAEKRDALERLAGLVELILNPAPNVVAMPVRAPKA
jgi:integrase